MPASKPSAQPPGANTSLRSAMGYKTTVAQGDPSQLTLCAPESDPSSAPQAPPDRDELPPRTVSADEASADYRIVRELGRGGMGVVYQARHRALRREVALKTPRGGPKAEQALLAEAYLAGALEHPNIIPVHDLGRDAEGRPLLVMKSVEGVTWRDLVANPGHPYWTREDSGFDAGVSQLTVHLRILIPICNALHFAHSQGIVHRDLKLENVMLGSFGEVYLVDWGIATRTASPADEYLVGTPACMPPEMVARERCDARTDVYLLGALLHELLTGEPRHQGPTLEDVLRSALCSDPVSYGPAIPAELAALCNAATSRDREARPATAAAFRRVVSGYLEHQSSLDIAARACERLTRLEQASDPADDRTIGAGLIECRLAFLEALRAWPQNDRASEGLSRTLRSMFSRELSQQNLVAARAILADFPDPPADLRARLAEAEASDEARRKEAEAQALRRREQDAKVSVLPRTVALLATIFLGTITLFAPVLGELSSGEPMSMRDVLLGDLAMVASTALALVFGRRYLLANTYNRNWWVMLSLSLLAGLANDLVIWRWGLSSTLSPQFGMISASTLFTLGAVTFEPRVWPLALASVLGFVAVAVSPALTTPVMAVVLLTMLAVIFSSWREYSSRAASAGSGGKAAAT